MIPKDVLKTLEKEIAEVTFGKINLEISVHDGKLKFRIVKEISIVPGKPMSGTVKA